MTRSPFAPHLASRGHVLLDGGLASQLELEGHDLDHALWSARLLEEDPDAIRRAHRAFLDAGADCVISASYQATPQGLRRAGASATEARALILRSLELAEQARDECVAQHGAGPTSPAPVVAASIGPYGAYLADGSEYRGDYGVGCAALVDFHRERFELLAERAELLAIETIPSLVEVEALRELLLEQPGVAAWMSFSCRDGAHLADGAPIERAADALADLENLVAVGVNCTAPEHVDSLLGRLAERRAGAELLAYPNSGERYEAETKTWSEERSSGDLPDLAAEWRARGARLIGGCCRVTAPDLTRLAAALGRP